MIIIVFIINFILPIFVYAEDNSNKNTINKKQENTQNFITNETPDDSQKNNLDSENVKENSDVNIENNNDAADEGKNTTQQIIEDNVVKEEDKNIITNARTNNSRWRI